MDARHAIEALRAGVPNRAAIRLLGTTEKEIQNAFLENLRRVRYDIDNYSQPTGQVIAGGFGTGKSHLLGVLKECALEEDFIVSWVPISKETPLSDPGKLFISAMRLATVPSRNDDAMTAVLDRLKPDSKGFDDVVQWAKSPEARLAPLFPALLHLLPMQGMTPERVQDLARFFAGAPLGIAKVKQWLAEAGAGKIFPVKTVKQADLVEQRLRFVPRLMTAAGYGGWVVLLDEIELIARYSLLQRARAYAELARWFGLDDTARIPGVVAVGAITDDFVSAVIVKRGDEKKAPLMLVGKNDSPAAKRASLGIDFMAHNTRSISPPSQQRLRDCLDLVSKLYEQAYKWPVPYIEVGQLLSTKTMRHHIKAWITTWDLERLYGTEPTAIETTVLRPNYDEDSDFEPSADVAGADFGGDDT